MMTQQEKREQKLNKVLKAVSERVEKLQDEGEKKSYISVLNMTGFLYGCGRMNDMQVIIRLAFIGQKLGMTENDLLILVDEKGNIYDEKD